MCFTLSYMRLSESLQELYFTAVASSALTFSCTLTSLKFLFLNEFNAEMKVLDTYSPNVTFLYVFRRYRNVTLGEYVLIQIYFHIITSLT